MYMKHVQARSISKLTITHNSKSTILAERRHGPTCADRRHFVPETNIEYVLEATGTTHATHDVCNSGTN
jgi:hypothetical protein